MFARETFKAEQINERLRDKGERVKWGEGAVTLSAIPSNRLEDRIVHKTFIVRLFSAHIFE